MNTVSFEGFNAKYLTFLKGGNVSLKAGDFVSIDKNFTVKAFAAGTDIVGKCVEVRDNLVTVQVSGYMTAPLAASQKISYGYVKISLDSTGKVTASTTVNRPVMVVEINGTNSIGFIL